MVAVNVTATGIPAALAAMKGYSKQLPFAMSNAINRALFDARAKVQAVMSSTLDRPTAFTLKSLRVVKSTKQSLTGALDFGNTPAGQRAAELWMSVEVEGGARRRTGLERLLAGKGVIPAGSYLVPTSNAKLDANGNWLRSQMRQVSLSFGLGFDKVGSARLAKSAARKTAGGVKRKAVPSKFFVITDTTGGLEPAIYERVKSAFGSGAKPLAIIKASAPRYKKRVPFYQVAERVAVKSFNEHLPEELMKAMKSGGKPGGKP